MLRVYEEEHGCGKSRIPPGEQCDHERLREDLQIKPSGPKLTEDERRSALELLRDPHLLERILCDLDACGVIGEETNKLAGYLAAVSRKLGENARKYPAERVRGSALKYDEYD